METERTRNNAGYSSSPPVICEGNGWRKKGGETPSPSSGADRENEIIARPPAHDRRIPFKTPYHGLANAERTYVVQESRVSSVMCNKAPVVDTHSLHRTVTRRASSTDRGNEIYPRNKSRVHRLFFLLFFLFLLIVSI